MGSWSLRTRITAWYMVLVAVTLALFSVFLHIRLESSLISQVDDSLEAAASQAMEDLEVDTGIPLFGSLMLEFRGEVRSSDASTIVLDDGTTFRISEFAKIGADLTPGLLVEIDARRLGEEFIAHEVEVASADSEDDPTTELATEDLFDSRDFVYRAVDGDGTVHDGVGEYWLLDFSPPEFSGFVTGALLENASWRVFTTELTTEDSAPVGWLQTATPLEDVNESLARLRTQLYLAAPLAILLAGFGGFFLADRGLRPIGRITRTARSITGTAMGRRIGYEGPDDEVGQLATTFDSMLDRLEASFEQERRFSSDVSHELRTPLTALKGRLDVTLNSGRTVEEYRETLDDMNGEVDRLIRLSNELLYLSRLEQGQFPWQAAKVALKLLLDSVIDQVRPLGQKKQLSFKVEIPDDAFATGDPDHLIRLFLNVLDNAVRYSPSGGVILVESKKLHQDVSVSITDSGPGISPDHLGHIFERFYRAEQARSRDEGGTGLGLAIALEIAHRHGGTLTVDSQPGAGTTVTATLPNGAT